MSGQWPTEWDDPEDFAEDAEQLDTEAEARLSEVAEYLASVPAPALPDAIEARISAALAAESALRAPEADRSRTLGPAPARARVRRRLHIRPALVGWPLVACLLFAGIVFGISRGSSSSSSSATAASAPSAVPEGSSAAASAAQGYSAGGNRSAVSGSSAALVIIESGTRYQAATLAGQVRAALVTFGASQASIVPGARDSAPASVSAPAASSSSAPAGLPAVTSRLRACVLHFTAHPRLIDRATYQGTPVYVIAGSSHVWVVGLECTAARPDLIASVSLAGLSRESPRPRIG
jgi:hypothetical protein